MSTNLLLVVATAALTATFSLLLVADRNYIVGLLGPPQLPTSRDLLHASAVVHVSGAFGPESIVFDPEGGGPYTGVADGRVLRWAGGAWSDFAVTASNRTECARPFAPELEHVCGRPLGLRFEKKTGNLFIADAYLGLLVVGPEGGLATPLITDVEGKRMLFTNDLDVDEEEDVIYFTDTSTVLQRRQFMLSILSVDKTGRLMKYDRAKNEVTVLLRGLAFANGVALSKDRSFVLVAETTASRVVRFWLQGPNSGNSEVFAELPGFPDNIRRNSKGEFWVALHSKKGVISNVLMSHPWIGRTMLKLPLDMKKLQSLMARSKPHATAIKLSEDGDVLDVLEDSEGKTLRFISEVEEKDGKLWIGSVMVPYLGVYDL